MRAMSVADGPALLAWFSRSRPCSVGGSLLRLSLPPPSSSCLRVRVLFFLPALYPHTASRSCTWVLFSLPRPSPGCRSQRLGLLLLPCRRPGPFCASGFAVPSCCAASSAPREGPGLWWFGPKRLQGVVSWPVPAMGCGSSICPPPCAGTGWPPAVIAPLFFPSSLGGHWPSGVECAGRRRRASVALGCAPPLLVPVRRPIPC